VKIKSPPSAGWLQLSLGSRIACDLCCLIAQKLAQSVMCTSRRGARPHFAVSPLQFALRTAEISTPSHTRIRIKIRHRLGWGELVFARGF